MPRSPASGKGTLGPAACTGSPGPAVCGRIFPQRAKLKSSVSGETPKTKKHVFTYFMFSTKLDMLTFIYV